MFNKDVKVPLQEAELVGTSSSNKEKEDEERGEEKEEVAAALDSNDVSCEQVDTYACDHAKQEIETQITSDKHKDPVPKVIDGFEFVKKCTG